MRILGVALAGIVVVALFSPVAQAKMTLKDKAGEKEVKLQIYGFSQLEMRGGEGWQLAKGNADDGISFQAQRIRVGFNYFHSGPIAGKLFLDFNQSHDDKDAGLPKMIKDAFVAYRHSNPLMVRLGMIKTPLGMDFTVPGWNLDIIERNGLEKGLVLERDFGLLVSGRLIGQDSFTDEPMKTNGLEMGAERQGYGFGYDIGVFNPAGRSSAVLWDDGSAVGDALAYTGRVHFDYGKPLHFEAAYGVSEQAGGFEDGEPKTEDYKVFDIGVASEIWKWGLEMKLEYIQGTNIRGEDGRDQSTVVGTVGWMFVPQAEVVLKTYQAEAERVGEEKTKLGNTYIGINVFPYRVTDKHRDLQRHKIVVNYVFVNGDDVDSDDSFSGLGGYDSDTFGVQWQYKY